MTKVRSDPRASSSSISTTLQPPIGLGSKRVRAPLQIVEFGRAFENPAKRAVDPPIRPHKMRNRTRPSVTRPRMMWMSSRPIHWVNQDAGIRRTISQWNARVGRSQIRTRFRAPGASLNVRAPDSCRGNCCRHGRAAARRPDRGQVSAPGGGVEARGRHEQAGTGAGEAGMIRPDFRPRRVCTPASAPVPSGTTAAIAGRSENGAAAVADHRRDRLGPCACSFSAFIAAPICASGTAHVMVPAAEGAHSAPPRRDSGDRQQTKKQISHAVPHGAVS